MMPDAPVTPIAAPLQGDRPIKTEAEDLLGFSSFAEALARALTEMAPDDGLVVSVEGEWGSGKTSALQLTERRIILRELSWETRTEIEELERKDWSSVEMEWDSLVGKRRTHLVRFNPWDFSGQENLVRAFFKEIGSVIGYPPNGAVANAIKKITNYLPEAGAAVGGAIAGAATHGAAIAPGATAGGQAGKVVRRLLEKTESLEAAKRQLAEALRHSGKRIVIIIDDLDRLLPSEMRAVFSLVKSLGDLPNILYVLSFDREAVISALQNSHEPISAGFLEKIIQVQLKLPPAWDPELKQLFLTRVDAIIGDATPNDMTRWRTAFLAAIAPYIKTPRDIARVCNSLQVMWPNIAGDVDLTDLIILTILQHFEPSIYQTIFENIEELCGETVTFEDDKAFAARFMPKEGVVKKLKAAKKAMAHLFPRLASGWNEHLFDGTRYIVKKEHRRLCTREYYRNYFLFGRDPDRISRAEIEGMLTCQDPRAPRRND